MKTGTALENELPKKTCTSKQIPWKTWKKKKKTVKNCFKNKNWKEK
jgi:hypothetical protein